MPDHAPSAAATRASARAGVTSPTTTSVAPSGRTRSVCSRRSCGGVTLGTSAGCGRSGAYGCSPNIGGPSASFATTCARDRAIERFSTSRARSLADLAAAGYEAAPSGPRRPGRAMWLRFAERTLAGERDGRRPRRPLRSPPSACTAPAKLARSCDADPGQDRVRRLRRTERRGPPVADRNGSRRRTSAIGTPGLPTARTRKPFGRVSSTVLSFFGLRRLGQRRDGGGHGRLPR